MKLSRRWKIGLAIAAYSLLVCFMAWYSLPHALTGALRFQEYQEEQTRRMIESAREHAAQEAAAGAEQAQ